MDAGIIIGILTLIGVCVTAGATFFSNRSNTNLEKEKFEEEKRRYREDKLEESILKSITLLEDNFTKTVKGSIDALETKMNERVDSLETKMNKRVDSLETKMNEKIELNNNGTKVAMKSSLRAMYDSFYEEEEINGKKVRTWNITSDDKKHWDEDFGYYSALGGNGEIKALDEVVQQKYKELLLYSKTKEDD